jgi:ketosteroid isomerase-like protein
MIKALKCIILLLLTCNQHVVAQKYSTIDIVKVNSIYEKEAMFYYNENWKPFRQEAYKKGFISGYEILKTETDSTKHFQLILITKYPDSISFHNKEENFAPIIKSISPNGPNMLNSISRKEMLEYVSGYEASEMVNDLNNNNDAINIRAAIEKIQRDYVYYWLKLDENRLMNLIDDNASIQPNTLKPIVGKENIRAFWFPNDGSKTTINEFTTKIVHFSMVDNLAITTHHSFLDFTYEKGTTLLKSKQKGINTTIYKQQQDKTWKIWKSMWADYDIVRE